MTVWAYTLAYNEATLMPYWIAHYKAFCERVVVYQDAATDDGTGGHVLLGGGEVRLHKTDGLDDEAFVAFAQECYKEARGRAEWVIWVDADEFLYHPRIGERLGELRSAGVTCPTVRGYQMVGDAPPSGPRPLVEQIRRGLPAREYSKVCVFSPELDVRWTAGKHTAEVPGAVGDDGADPLKLLHYRYLGEAWLRARNARNHARMGEGQLARRHGVETYPDYDGVYSAAWYAAQTTNAVEVVG